MLIFNTTFHTEDDVHDTFLGFMKHIYIPQSLSSGFLHSPCLAYIHAQHEQAGASYALQFKVKNIETLNLWLSNDGEALQQSISDRFGNKVAGFITVMNEIEL